MSRGTAFPTRLHMRPAKTAHTDQSLRCRPNDALAPWLHTKLPAMTDHTMRMNRLTRVFPGHICNR